MSDVSTDEFCSDGSRNCAQPKLPHCQDRTILCLEELDVPAGMKQTNLTSNLTLHSHAIGAMFSYTCETEGNKDFVCHLEQINTGS